MAITPKKNQYALRAIFELAKHLGQGPKKISEIAEAQAIPMRFLEVILGQLKSSGWVDSKRGFYGGYFLKCSPKEISVGDILRFMQGTSKPTECVACVSKGDCPFDGHCAFAPMWNKVDAAMFKIYDETSIHDLLKMEAKSIDSKKL
ncbi:MAG: Rrf2 family transcriptional regulator [Desulfobacterales bacterium]|jgi:Rrf2 family protein|nr:Rrf2 family transcriptional regulator [Deltaproteobacteria bacterium]